MFMLDLQTNELAATSSHTGHLRSRAADGTPAEPESMRVRAEHAQ